MQYKVLIPTNTMHFPYIYEKFHIFVMKTDNRHETIHILRIR